jgi:MFS family permease
VQPSGPARRRALAGLVVVGLGASAAPLDFAVNIAFPAITDAFGLDARGIRWVAVCYVLTYGSLMLACGALGDRIGHLRMFRAGVLLGAVAFALCALAPTYPTLLAARALQGVAVALTLSCAPALATALFPEERRTWALSAYAGMAALAGVAAPLAGGLAVGWLGWPGVYWMRVPIMLAAFACVPMLARALRAPPAGPPAAFDARAAGLLAGGMGLLLLVPAVLGPAAWLWPALPLAGGGMVLLALLARLVRAGAAPLMPRPLLRDAAFVLHNAGNVVVQFTSFAIPLVVPYYLARMGGWSPLASGGLLAFWALGALGGSAMVPALIRALGVRRAALAGGLAVIAGLAAIALWPPVPDVALMAGCLLLQGLGLGVYQVAYSDLVVAALPPARRGVAGSLTMVTRTIGVVLGASLLTSAVQVVEAGRLAAGAAALPAYMAAFCAVFAGAAGVAALFFVVSGLWRGTWGRTPAR